MHPGHPGRDERHGHVDDDLAARGIRDIGHGLTLGGEGNGDHDDVGLGGRIGVGRTLDRAVFGEGFRRGRGALGRARADDHAVAGARPTDGEPGAFRPGAADDRDDRKIAHRTAAIGSSGGAARPAEIRSSVTGP